MTWSPLSISGRPLSPKQGGWRSAPALRSPRAPVRRSRRPRRPRASVRPEIVVAAAAQPGALDGQRRPARPVRALEDERCSDCPRQPRRQPGMVAVRVGQQHRLDHPSADRAQQRLEVPLVRRSRVDHDEPRLAEEEAVGAGEGERPAVGRRHPHDARRDRHGRAGLRLEPGVVAEGGGGLGHCAHRAECLEITRVLTRRKVQ